MASSHKTRLINKSQKAVRDNVAETKRQELKGNRYSALAEDDAGTRKRAKRKDKEVVDHACGTSVERGDQSISSNHQSSCKNLHGGSFARYDQVHRSKCVKKARIFEGDGSNVAKARGGATLAQLTECRPYDALDN